jgi:hypothetical protein
MKNREFYARTVEQSHLAKLPPTTCYTAVLHLKLPPHAVPGKPFEIFANNTILTVFCPAGYKPGDTVRIQVGAYPMAPAESLTKDQKQAESPESSITTEVGSSNPEDLPVRSFYHPFKKKTMYTVKVPEGKNPGDKILVHVPEPLSGRSTAVTVSIPRSHGPGMYLSFSLPATRLRKSVLEEYGRANVEEE